LRPFQLSSPPLSVPRTPFVCRFPCDGDRFGEACPLFPHACGVLPVLPGSIPPRQSGGIVSADEVKEDFNLLCRFNAALAVTLMHKHFFHKLVKHGRCHGVLIFLDQGNKLVG